MVKKGRWRNTKERSKEKKVRKGERKEKEGIERTRRIGKGELGRIR